MHRRKRFARALAVGEADSQHGCAVPVGDSRESAVREAAR